MDKENRVNESNNLLTRLVIIVAGLVCGAAAVFIAILSTAFAGSMHGAPDWYLPYLITTQAIPILVFSISWFAIIFTAPSPLFSNLWVKILVLSVTIYITSFGLIFVIYPN